MLPASAEADGEKWEALRLAGIRINVTCKATRYAERPPARHILRSFKHKGLQELFETGKSAKIDKKMHARIVKRLDALDSARRPEDAALPGFDFHPLTGFRPTRYSIHVNGPWCVTFEFEGEDVVRVDFEQYH